MKKIPKRLITDKVYLRPLTKRDAPHIFSAIDISRKELRPWMIWEATTLKTEDTYEYIRRTQTLRIKGTTHDFGIFDSKTHEYVGGGGLGSVCMVNQNGMLGYWVRSDRHKEGIGFAASVLILRFGFEELKLHKVWVMANVKNLASRKLIRKLGFKKEGVSRDHLCVNGSFGDYFLAGLLEDEYRKQKPRFDKLVPRS